MLNKKTKNRFTLLARIIPLAILGVAVPLAMANASWFLKQAFLFVAWMAQLTLFITCYLFALSGKMFNWVYQGGFDVLSDPVVTVGWGVTRDVLNMFFVIALLVIAFATILRIESYAYKALLPKLIYAALLVNFSKTIATVFVDFSNMLMKTLLNLDQGTFSETFALALFKYSPTTIPNAMSQGLYNAGQASGHEVAFNLVLAIYMTIFLLGLVLAALFALAAIMIIRNTMLMILTILSPAAFVLYILPSTQQYAKKWWDEFLKYVFYGPVAAFCVYLAAVLAQNIGTAGGSDQMAGWILSDPTKLDTILTPTGFYRIIVMVVFLWVSVLMIKSLSPKLAAMASGLARRTGRLAGAASWGLTKAGGRWTRRRIANFGKGPLSKEFAKTSLGQRAAAYRDKHTARMEDKNLGYIQRGRSALTSAFMNIPKGIRMAPELMEGWKARREDIESESSRDPVKAEARDWLNYVVGTGAKTRYERQARRTLADKKLKDNPAKTSDEQQAKVEGATTMAEKEGAWKGIVADNNTNNLVAKFNGLFDEHRESTLTPYCAEQIAKAITAAKADPNNPPECPSMLNEKGREKWERGDYDDIGEDDHLITGDSAPVWHPEILREIMSKDLGESPEAYEIMGEIGELAFDNGIIAMGGIANQNKETGKWQKSDNAYMRMWQEDKMRKIPGRTWAAKAHSNAVFTENPDGSLGELHTQGEHLLSRMDWAHIDKYGEHGRKDVQDGVVSIGSNGRSNVKNIKRRAMFAVSGAKGSRRSKLQRKIADMQAQIASGTLTDQESQAAQAELNMATKENATLVSDMSKMYAFACRIEQAKTGKIDLLQADGSSMDAKPGEMKNLRGTVEAHMDLIKGRDWNFS